MLATVLRPTGCRSSHEAEASWRLTAAAVAVRVLQTKGVLPIFKDMEDPWETPVSELHVPLRDEDLQLFTKVSEEEGGSRGELARMLLLTTQRIVDEFSGSLNHDGLVVGMISRFSPLSDPVPAEW